MKKKEILESVKKQLLKGDYQYKIDKYLKGKNLTPEETSNIIEQAKEIIREERLKTLPNRNKLIFSLLACITICIFIFFFLFIPSQGLYGVKTVLAILGAVTIWIPLSLTISFYNSWLPERINPISKTKNNILNYFLIAALPTLILGFVFNIKHSSVQKRELDKNAIVAVALLNDGHSFSTRRFDFTSLFVRFKTKDGKSIATELKVPKHEFKNYVYGQKLLIEYSSKFPQNIRIIKNKKRISEVVGSEERMPLLAELEELIDLPKNKMVSKLDKFLFGWYLKESVYVNPTYDMKLHKYKNEIILTSSQNSMKDYTVLLNYSEKYSLRKGRETRSLFSQSGTEYHSSTHAFLFYKKNKKANYKNEYYFFRPVDFYLRVKKISNTNI